MMRNLILRTDSYKLSHPSMLPSDTVGMHEYLEARADAESPYQDVVWFGLQAILMRYLTGVVVTADHIAEARAFQAAHMPGTEFNLHGWENIVRKHGGRLPVTIRAVAEGSVIPRGHALMTTESEYEPWLPGHLESILQKVWYPTTVATRLFRLRRQLRALAIETGCASDNLYQVHDFGYRGASSEESAMIGGAAHLVVYRGSDTLIANQWLAKYYGADMVSSASVAASEHSVMTSAGRAGEHALAERLIWQHQDQVLSLVGDSYDYYGFVQAMIERHKQTVSGCRCRLVIRPDSTTTKHPTPAGLVRWTLDAQRNALPCTTTPTGHIVVPFPVLWGDGIDDVGMMAIAAVAVDGGYAASNLVFGSGGWNLQKCNRDTLRIAAKASARQVVDDVGTRAWLSVKKETPGKTSKAGRLALVRYADGTHETVAVDDAPHDSLLVPVFENGMLLRSESLRTVRDRVTEAVLRAPLRTPLLSAPQPVGGSA